MSDDFFAGWTDLGDDADDPFNATSAAASQQFVQPPPATQPEPAQAPAPQQVTAAPQAQFYPAPQHPAAPLTASAAMPTAPAPQQAVIPGTTPPVMPMENMQYPAVPVQAMPNVIPQPAPTEQHPAPAVQQPMPPTVQPAMSGMAVNPLMEAAEQADNKAVQAMAKSLTELLPVFSYNDCEEEITNPNMSFEDLRLEKMEDFTEMEDRTKVKWFVKYGSVKKEITKPKQESIAKVKAAIEVSAEFLAGLKKAKNKNPRCKVEPVVYTQKKGIAAYKGLFATPEEAAESDKMICIFPARDGRVYEMRKTQLGTFTVPRDTVEELSQVSAGFKPALPLVPHALFTQILAFFKFYAAQEKPLETLVNLYWDTKMKRFLPVIPRQKVTGVEIETMGEDGLDTERYIHYMDLHSHNIMPAFFSATDNADEKAARVYIVVGRLQDAQPQIMARISCSGHFQSIPLESVVEVYKPNFPKHWQSSIITRARKAGGGKGGVWF